MRLLAALKILEDATLDSKKRDIDTPEVRQALDRPDPICLPKWRVAGFRDQPMPHAGQLPHELEGHQQVLRVYFGGIYTCVRQLLAVRIKKLNYWYKKDAKQQAPRTTDNGSARGLFLLDLDGYFRI